MSTVFQRISCLRGSVYSANQTVSRDGSGPGHECLMFLLVLLHLLRSCLPEHLLQFDAMK